jgi:hypothetical protein
MRCDTTVAFYQQANRKEGRILQQEMTTQEAKARCRKAPGNRLDRSYDYPERGLTWVGVMVGGDTERVASRGDKLDACFGRASGPPTTRPRSIHYRTPF